MEYTEAGSNSQVTVNIYALPYGRLRAYITDAVRLDTV